MILDTLFGETGFKIVVVLIVLLALVALGFWLVRRLGGGRLGGSATRGRQPRLAVIDQAAVDGRRRLVLIRRDNVEHLLIIGGPTDVVVEQNILRAVAAQRELAPVRPATDALPRAVPLGEDSTWPLQPEPGPKLEPMPKVEPAPRLEPSLRADGAPRPPHAPTAAEEPEPWPTEIEAPAVPPPPAAAPPPMPSPAAAARERRPLSLDPLAGLAEELSRIPTAAEAGSIEQRQAARRAARLPPGPPPMAPVPPAAADTPAPSADQNLSEMAQRLEAALRRPAKAGDKPAADGRGPGAPTPAGVPEADPFAPRPRSARLESALRRPFKADDLRAASPVPAAPRMPGEPAAAGSDEPAPAAPSAPRLDAGLRRPFRADDLRHAAPAPKEPGEPAATEGEDAAPPGAPAPDAATPTGGEAKPRSLYDSLEQEMASLLNRPTPKP